MELITAVLGFIVAVGVLVVVHEMGHFSVARWAGVKVLRFSIGFGKPIFQHRARNGTEWSVGWLPLGGYVKMLDERESPDVAASIDPRDLPHAFNRQSVGKRFAIVAAGPVANFLLAIFLFTALHLVGTAEPAAIVGAPPAGSVAAAAGVIQGERVIGLRRPGDSDAVPIQSWPQLQRTLDESAGTTRALILLTRRDDGLYEHSLRLAMTGADGGPSIGTAANGGGRNGTAADGKQDRDGSEDASAGVDVATRLGLMPGGTPQVAAVEADSPAQRAGLRAGDRILRADGVALGDAEQLVAAMRAAPGRTVRLDIVRNGLPLRLDVTPTVIQEPRNPTPIGRIGAALGVHLPMVDVRYGPVDALRLAAQHTWDIASTSVQMFGRMLTGQASLKNLSGPVTIADYAGRSARMGLAAFVSFVALISISLGVLNLLPIPVLDGGHLLYYAVEALTGRALSDRWQSIMQRAGLFCIVALSIVALCNDLSRLAHS